MKWKKGGTDSQCEKFEATAVVVCQICREGLFLLGVVPRLVAGSVASSGKSMQPIKMYFKDKMHSFEHLCRDSLAT